MISSSHKFPLRTSFLEFKKHAKKLSTPNLLIYYLASSHSGSGKPKITLPECNSRLGVVIPKKVHKLATVRNWLKRLTYDTLWPRLKDQKMDVVIVYKPLPLVKSPQTKIQIISQLSKNWITGVPENRNT